MLWALTGTRLNVQYAHFVATRAIFAETSLGKTFAMPAAARNVMRPSIERVCLSTGATIVD